MTLVIVLTMLVIVPPLVYTTLPLPEDFDSLYEIKRAMYSGILSALLFTFPLALFIIYAYQRGL